MPIEFKLPKLGENIPAGDIVSVLVKEGDQIAADTPVFDVMADKTNAQVVCPHAGKIAKIHVKEGQTVPIGDVLLSIEAAEGAEAAAPKPPAPAPDKPAPAPDKPGPAPAPAAPAPPSAPVPRPAQPPPAPVARESNSGPAPAAPATRRYARELGVDLGNVPGSGPGGRITRDDVSQAVRQHVAAPAPAAPTQGAPAPAGPSPVSAPAIPSTPGGVDDQDGYGKVRREPLTRIRKTIAANMSRSHNTIPHVTNFDDADITELERIRKGSMSDYVDKQVKLTMMSFVMKAVAHALKLHPTVNASLDLEGEQVVYKQYVNVGVAVDTDRGLVVPVMRGVDKLSIPQIAQGLTNMAEQARKQQFSVEDMRGGSFTISNLGAIGGTYSTPIINFPEVAVLLVGRSRKLPVVIDDAVQVRLMMPLSLSYDHRWIDGATAARFLNEIIGFLEVPGRLLLAP